MSDFENELKKRIEESRRQSYLGRLNDPPHIADAMQYAMQYAMQHGQIMPYIPPKVPSMTEDRSDDPMRMIYMRMTRGKNHLPGNMWWTLPHISAFVNDKTAVVFIVNKDGKPVAIEDDPDLFPSDALITKLRLLNQ